MDLQQLRIFRAAAMLGGFTRASEELNLSQSTVSQHMKQLEESLGCQLFLRVGKRVYLNDAGRLLLRFADKISSELKNAEMAVREMNTLQRGTVRLGVGASTLIYLLPRVLSGYRKRYPQIELIVSSASTESLIQSVAGRTLDLAIVMQPVTAIPTLQVDPIMREELVIAVNSADPLAAKGVLTAKDLEGVPFISYMRHTSMRSLVESYFEAVGAEQNVTMELENIEAIKSLVRAGLGAAVLPYCSVAGGVSGAGLKILRMKDVPMYRELFLALPKSEVIPIAIRKLAARIMQVLPNSFRRSTPAG